MNKRVMDHDYAVELLVSEDFADLNRWVALEADGYWEVKDGGVEGEWLRGSPSLFLKEKVKGDFLWEVDVTRLETGKVFEERYRGNKHGIFTPAMQYNFNFWIRVDVPEAPPTGGGETFFAEYPKWLKTGWNGMGDDHWRSYFNTVVWKPGENWVRLRRGPGYEKREDVQDAVPFMDWGEKHRFTFAVKDGRVRLYFDESILVYDHADAEPYGEGFIGLCVWLCKVRFERMRVWRVTG